MLYCCSGTHRSGKTTAAKLLAEQLGIEFLDSSFDVAKKFGYNPVGRMSLKDRMAMQILVLDDHIEKLNAAPRPLITDRCPLDYFAYTLAQFGMTSHEQADEQTLQAAHAFAEKCLDVTKTYYDMVFIMDPLRVYEVDPTKATPVVNPAFQLHIHALIHGAVSQIHREINYAIVPFMPLQDRVDFIAQQIVERMDDIDDLKQSVGMH
ncbi:P-loop NTPase domain-containing protein [Rhizobium phage RHph_N1_15]|nr:P-loop NTPase domain-containing protein [Rhizobium phage RHph_N1_10]QIG69320.1 P-loop NTPase domain-containing protein [Rhizobium phage RHph_N1_15]QIG75180.1 P-loop NTPase domain-containing protein [Rhizobium phage RHph_N2_6]